MREIIFRGKRIDNGEWVYGHYIRNEHMGIIKHIIVTDWAQVYVNSFKVDPDTLGQFSGLRDNKRTAEFPEGQEIFEGDIVKRKRDNTVRVVIFKDGSFLTERIKPRSRCVFNSFPFYEYDEWEVIGNVHEHRNLLGGEVD